LSVRRNEIRRPDPECSVVYFHCCDAVQACPMNEHIRKGNEAIVKGDLQTAKAEFHLALADPNSLTQRIAKNRLRELVSTTLLAGTEQTGYPYNELIAPATSSRCCNAKAIFVKSRDGGFIAKNCTRCKKSGYARTVDFPMAQCCGTQWPVVLIGKNYHYQCGECGKTIMVADNVPKWSDLFPYDPLPAPGDPGWDSI
jgi:hypothetical protein